MALKFLNKKGWHTGSLRNIENVWKAEQKHEAEQRKLEELRKQIQEERERAEFRLLQERAGLVPRQERLEFLYESGLAVGKSISEGFKALQGPPQAETSAVSASEASSSKAAVPGALFEEKPQSANDAWRKLHSDPLLLIRQKEQDAIARIKNNPIQMAMIKKSVEAERQQQEKSDKKGKKKKKEHKKHRHKKSKNDKHSSESGDSEDTDKGKEQRRDKHRDRRNQADDEERKRKHRDRGNEADNEERRHMRRDREDEGRKEDRRHNKHGDREDEGGKARDSGTEHRSSRPDGREERRRHRSSDNHRLRVDSREEGSERFASGHHRGHGDHQPQDKPQEQSDTHRRRRPPGLTKEERAARLREMQADAELHEEQRWKRIKRASEADAPEAVKDKPSLGGNNFLDAAQKSLFGTEKGGSSTIEESVRRRAFYSQGGVAAHETNAFRRR